MLPENIRFTSDPSKEILDFLSARKYSKIAIVVDENTKVFCYPLLSTSLPAHDLITISGGEEHKTLDTCVRIWQIMTDLKLDRHSLVIILGGGVLGDMGGFCAATFKRGIDFILIPTTLLGQVDASIGGKLGIDFNHFKNHIGVFQLPVLTLLYNEFLKTLPVSELRSGYAEVIKHVLTSDAGMWKVIRKKSLQDQDWEILIRHSVNFKARVVSEDPRENSLRKILNAGHTIGHAIESYSISTGNRLLHGEAIAVGLVAEAFIAKQKNMLREEDLSSIANYILSVYAKVDISERQIDYVAQLVVQDKKNMGNRILCVLLDGIGSARWDVEINLDEVKEALSFYQSQR